MGHHTALERPFQLLGSSRQEDGLSPEVEASSCSTGRPHLRKRDGNRKVAFPQNLLGFYKEVPGLSHFRECLLGMS
jgi:hypothetical protein